MPNFPAVLELSSLDGTNGFRIDGSTEADVLGGSVSTAGDVNGDGIADIIVGANNFDPNGSFSGSAYVVFGNVTSAFSATLNVSTLNGVNGFRIDGEQAYDSLGVSVSSAGDVNGDGIDDLIVGARRHAGSDAYNSGAAYVVFGARGVASPSIDVSSLDGTNGFKLAGFVRNDYVGQSVSAAGDINGDGFDDLIVGARGIDGSGYAQGASYVVFGKGTRFSSLIDLSELDGANGFKLESDGASVGAHSSVSSAGDVNGDGIDDLIVGVNASEFDAAFVVFGKRTAFGPTLELAGLNGSDGFKIDGAAFGYGSSSTVSSAGDVNGDGFDDLIVGATYSVTPDERSTSYVVFGKASGFDATLALSSLNGANGFRIVGEQRADKSGFSVSSAGDVNGDGFGDLIVGAPGAVTSDGQFLPIGAAYVVFGKQSGFSANLDLANLTGANGFKIAGEVDSSRQGNAGASVSAAGDINQDGFDDLIVGDLSSNRNGFNSGSAYVIYGQATEATNRPPTDIALSGSGVNEFSKKGIVVGTLSAIDPDPAQTFTFRLLDDAGGRFTLAGRRLEVDQGLLLDFEQARSDTVRVRVTDGDGASYVEVLTIAVKDVNPEKVTGSAGRDVLVGGARADTFTGLGGGDDLTGGGGRDTLIGGLGRDTLDGGAGADTFKYGALNEGGDTIARFGAGDKIDVRAIDAEPGGGDQRFAFVGEDRFGGTAGELRFEVSGQKTIVSADVNGDRRADFTIALEGSVGLERGDFVL